MGAFAQDGRAGSVHAHCVAGPLPAATAGPRRSTLSTPPPSHPSVTRSLPDGAARRLLPAPRAALTSHATPGRRAGGRRLRRVSQPGPRHGRARSARCARACAACARSARCGARRGGRCVRSACSCWSRCGCVSSVGRS
eukprot:134499-Chlamydomonas_euryale.AAC.3